MDRIVRGVTALAFLGLLALAQPASAQYSQGFDGLDGSASGVTLTGQDGYYLPNATGDVDFNVYTYADNTLLVTQNPEGGTQFIGGTGPGNGTEYARAQRNVGFGLGVWEVSYDFCGIFAGTPPATDNVGSFSMRQAANTVHINLFTWANLTNPTAINSNYVAYDATGTQFPVPGILPGPEWSNLSTNHWYRCRTVFDFDQNLIIEVGIRDLSGGSEAIYYPTGWYLVGGAYPPGVPEAIRFFGGGGGPGNTTCWDNAVVLEQGVVPTGACCAQDGICTTTTQSDCQGLYQGDNTVCEPNPCEGVPVRVSTWGAIKNLYH